MGIKGAGADDGAAPAVMNAVIDALHRAYGIDHIDMPATPLRLGRDQSRQSREFGAKSGA